jgi:glycine/D-amino acid oxidase-like deaminating enzyme
MARVQADITVRGGGIFGLCIAYEAARRGARVQLVETQALGAGSSGGVVGALTPHVPENWNSKKAFQLDSLLMAQEFWEDVEQCADLPTGYARLGRLQAIGDAQALTLANARAISAADLWQGRATWQVRPATGAAHEPRSATQMLIEDTLSARLHPRLAAQALRGAITALDGEVIEGADAPDQGAVVWATGLAGLNDLTHALGRPMGSGVKGQAALLQCDLRNCPQIYAESLHIVPHIDGTVGIGSTSENQWQDPSSTDALLEALIARARAVMPALQDAPVLQRWAGLRPRASSRAPLLGQWPQRAGHYVANGGFKIGFGMAPKVAQVMADLILDGRDTIPPDFKI